MNDACLMNDTKAHIGWNNYGYRKTIKITKNLSIAASQSTCVGVLCLWACNVILWQDYQIYSYFSSLHLYQHMVVYFYQLLKCIT